MMLLAGELGCTRRGRLHAEPLLQLRLQLAGVEELLPAGIAATARRVRDGCVGRAWRRRVDRHQGRGTRRPRSGPAAAAASVMMPRRRRSTMLVLLLLLLLLLGPHLVRERAGRATDGVTELTGGQSRPWQG